MNVLSIYIYTYIYISTYLRVKFLNWLEIEIFAYNMNKFHIYIYSPTICMNWLDIEILA